MRFQQWMFIILALSLSATSYAIDYDKYKKRKARQQIGVLEAAKKAADKWEFDKAEELLEKAKNMSYAPDKVKSVKKVIKNERFAKSEKERQAREAKEREYAEQQRRQQRQQRQQSRSSSSASSSGCSHFVSFSFDGPGPEHSSRIQISGPSGIYINGNGSSSVSAESYGGCIGGSYSFSYANNADWIHVGDPDYRSYSGRFSVPSTASICSVTISDGFGVDVYVNCN